MHRILAAIMAAASCAGHAQAQGGRARIAAAIAAADLRLAVTRTYVDAAAAERRLVTAREQAIIAREGFRVANVRVRAGRA